MIQFYKHSRIDKNKWDECISNSLSYSIFATSAFLDIASPHWCALIEDDYKSVMPLPVRKKFSFNYIYTPFFFSRLGVFATYPLHPQIIYDFFLHIPKKFIQIDLNLNSNNSFDELAPSHIHLRSYSIDLAQPYTQLYNRFSENTKRNIKSSHKFLLHYTDNCTAEEVISLFKTNRGKSKSIKYKESDYQYFIKLIQYAQTINSIKIVGVRDELGQLLAGAVFLIDRHRIWFWFSGRDNHNSEKKGMFFLIDNFIQKHANQDFIFDFNGSMNENVARFYKGFGGEEYWYNRICCSRLHYLTPIIKVYKSIFNK